MREKGPSCRGHPHALERLPLDQAQDGNEGGCRERRCKLGRPRGQRLAILAPDQHARPETRTCACRQFADYRPDKRSGYANLERRKQIGH